MNQYTTISRALYQFSKLDISHIPSLQTFLHKSAAQVNQIGPKFYIETYGCQMNSNDSQIVSSILQSNGYSKTEEIDKAEIILLNTCAIRANAENKIFTRLGQLKGQKKIIGLLGCMAERLKQQLWDHGAQIVVGPDSYRSLPDLLYMHRQTNSQQADTQLGYDETYDDIIPITPADTATNLVSIMRGCNNMCSFCIVPFTRGRERSRNPDSILQEIKQLEEQGVREITLLGQNVNSYFYKDESVESEHQNSEGFVELYKLRNGNGVRFETLLEKIAQSFPEMRIRFTSPHPKDFPDRVLHIINQYPNLANSLHMPCQSGSDKVLQSMRRYYTRDAVMQLCSKARSIVQDCAITTDVIVGFCNETEADFNQTVDLLQNVKFENAYMFAYSMRERTHAHRNYTDDVTAEAKQNRLERLIKIQHQIQAELNQQEIGQHLVLVEGSGKKDNQIKGRTDTNKPVIFENTGNYKVGDFVIVQIESASLKSLHGFGIRQSTISEFAKLSNNRSFIVC